MGNSQSVSRVAGGFPNGGNALNGVARFENASQYCMYRLIHKHKTITSVLLMSDIGQG